MLGHEITNVKRENSKSILTGRELEYLSLASIGCENKMIGTILTVSKATVKKTFEDSVCETACEKQSACSNNSICA